MDAGRGGKPPDPAKAVEAGINFFDTANVYSDGTSEEIVGRALKEFARREEVVIAAKVHGRMRPGPDGAGLSRRAIMTEIDASLARLGTDCFDLYQIHRFDPEVPLEALHDVVKAGKARYVGASSMYAWQFATMLHMQDANGRARFVTMQNYLNLLYREEEREMLLLCAAEGIGVIPWSPLARGRLTRHWDETTSRSQTDQFGKTLYRASEDADRAVSLMRTALHMMQVGLWAQRLSSRRSATPPGRRIVGPCRFGDRRGGVRD